MKQKKLTKLLSCCPRAADMLIILIAINQDLYNNPQFFGLSLRVLYSSDFAPSSSLL